MKNIKIIVACGLAACLLGGCSLLPKETEAPALPLVQAEQTPEYKTETVVRGSLDNLVEIKFNSIALSEVDLGFVQSGQHYGSISVKAGDTVAAGDLLAELDNSALEAEALEIDEQLKKLEIEYTYMAKRAELSEKYKSQATELEDKIYIAKLRLSEIHQREEERRLYSPIDGTVTYVKSIGDTSTTIKNSTVVTITQGQQSAFSGMTEYYDSFTPGETFSLAVGDDEYSAVCVAPEELGFQQNITEKDGIKQGSVYLELEDKDVFFEGTSVRGTVTLLLDSREDTLYLPNKAIISVEGQKMVYVQDDTGIRSAIAIETGMETDKYTEVLSGLQEGQQVLLGAEHE